MCIPYNIYIHNTHICINNKERKRHEFERARRDIQEGFEGRKGGMM
jgi:type IV secretory pathway VirD2 relaxase